MNPAVLTKPGTLWRHRVNNKVVPPTCQVAGSKAEILGIDLVRLIVDELCDHNGLFRPLKRNHRLNKDNDLCCFCGRELISERLCSNPRCVLSEQKTLHSDPPPYQKDQS